MSSLRVMTIGFLLVFFGAQLYAVKAFQLSPRVAKFVKDRMGELNDAPEATTAPASPSIFPTTFSGGDGQSTATGLGNAPTIRPPTWLRWATLFAGVVLILHGATLAKDE